MKYKDFDLPDGMTVQVKKYICAVIDTLDADGKLLAVDAMAVYSLAESYSAYVQASKVIRKEGLTVEGSRGAKVAHPAIKIARDAKRDCLDICRDFGLTLASRGKIKETAITTEESPLTRFMKTGQ